MSNSPLVCYTKISPNRTSPRNHAIDTISIHCMAGQLSVESCGAVFQNKSRKASSNYGIGPDGRIGMYVEEKDRSWCTSNSANDNRAITIEVASNSKDPYAVNDAAYKSLINLLVDICKRNNIKKLLWQGNPALIGQIAKQNMTVHRWFAKKACPGDYLYNKHAQIAADVNKRLGVSTAQITSSTTNSTPATPYNSTVVNPTTPIIMSAKILTAVLNVRSGPGMQYAQVSTVKKNQVIPIIQQSGNWGKLKDGRGWISLNPKYVKTFKS